MSIYKDILITHADPERVNKFMELLEVRLHKNWKFDREVFKEWLDLDKSNVVISYKDDLDDLYYILLSRDKGFVRISNILSKKSISTYQYNMVVDKFYQLIENYD